jgi:hypothetical protein
MFYVICGMARNMCGSLPAKCDLFQAGPLLIIHNDVINLGSYIIIWNQNSKHVPESRKGLQPPNKFVIV